MEKKGHAHHGVLENSEEDLSPSMPGPGGFPGGLGQSPAFPAQPGFGPGGGMPYSFGICYGGSGAMAHKALVVVVVLCLQYMAISLSFLW